MFLPKRKTHERIIWIVIQRIEYIFPVQIFLQSSRKIAEIVETEIKKNQCEKKKSYFMRNPISNLFLVCLGTLKTIKKKLNYVKYCSYALAKGRNYVRR